MTDILLGATLPQFTDDPHRFTQGAARAEEVGLDSVWVFDHLWPLSGGKERAVLEGWTSLAWLAAATERLHIGSLVTRAGLRHPALLAKMVATVSTIAPGRLIVGIGSGDEASRAENEAFGIPYQAEADRIAQLESTVRLLRELPMSPPVQAPPFWLGGRADDVLALAARYADGWNGWGGTPEQFARDAGQVLEYAQGRDLELSWGGTVFLAADDDVARSRLGDRDPDRNVWGGPDRVAAALNGFVEAGARHLVVTPAGPAAPDFYVLLGEQVRPRLG